MNQAAYNSSVWTKLGFKHALGTDQYRIGISIALNRWRGGHEDIIITFSTNLLHKNGRFSLSPIKWDHHFKGDGSMTSDEAFEKIHK